MNNINQPTPSARQAWTKPEVVSVTPVNKTRAGLNPQPTGEVGLYNPVS